MNLKNIVFSFVLLCGKHACSHHCSVQPNVQINICWHVCADFQSYNVRPLTEGLKLELEVISSVLRDESHSLSCNICEEDIILKHVAF